MTNTHLPLYDSVREYIKTMRNQGKSWVDIFNIFNQLNSVGLIPEFVTEEIWKTIVKEQQEESENSEIIEKATADTTIISKGEDNNVSVPRDPKSSWQLYRKKLLEDGWENEVVDSLEETTLRFLKKLSIDTSNSGPVKGLVIGKVQSGKTASMAALMAMASDWGWNTFIVLSGMIENLRAQTQERLFNDLNHAGNTTWISLKNLSRNTDIDQRLQTLKLQDNAKHRYLNVCLKNKKRLENLISWLESDKKKLQKMKILVIDDEGDQASINTKKSEEDRAKINELIIRLVEVGNNSNTRPKSMNYISYTATPYANFLNESSNESLYSRDFIGMLTESKEYFGSKEIFGLEGSEEYNGMDIIRKISNQDVVDIKQLQDGKVENLPKSFQESICWFFCVASVMRYYKYKKPISMLVHTSQKQEHHQRVADALDNWIKHISISDLLQLCREFYNQEQQRFNISSLRLSYKDYSVPDNELNSYPSFNQLKDEIIELKGEISHIRMNEEGDLTYHNGIHLCIDNCANNGVNEEDMHIRLAYPSRHKLDKLEKAPAFIVVGGSTLSRGLTIEGLVSTYFLRASTAADSLMQMGRWFGYRKGYEIFPRLWMTEGTYEKFCFLSTLEEELRAELREFAIDNKSPAEYGPRIKNTPKLSWLRITAKNKMQNAEEVDMDFSGSSIQTIHFENNKEILMKNLEVTERFLEENCNEPEKTRLNAQHALVYENVKFDVIRDKFLLKMTFNKRSRAFNQIDSFCEWYEEVKDEIGFRNWNVIVAGSGQVIEAPKDRNKDDGKWRLGKFLVGRVNRSAKTSSMNYSKDIVNIGVLRGPNDMFADINDPEFLDNQTGRSIKNESIREVRNKYGLGDVPQLIIYRIKKDSVTKVNSKNLGRRNLQFDHDIIGVYINIPGSNTKKPYAKALRVKIDPDEDID